MSTENTELSAAASSAAAHLDSSTAPHGLWFKLYNGLTNYEFISRWKRWFTMSAAVIAIGLLTLGLRGLNLGIDFTGGTVWQVPANTASVADARDVLRPLGFAESKIQTLESGGQRYLRVQGEDTTPEQQAKITAALAKLNETKTSEVSVSKVGASWGKDVTNKALKALVVFFLAIVAYISLRFELKMAIAAVAAVVHDILVTVGIYAVSGLPVSPATVIAFLTILGYSLYDTVVVFDKVDENVAALGPAGRTRYSDIVNLSMNQMLMRSINTSLVAILPILSLLVIGAGIMGARALADFGFALFIGLLTGAYSSIFIASPLLAMLKEREPQWKAISDKISEKTAKSRQGTDLAAAASAAAARAADIDATQALTCGNIPRPRKRH
jgi:preprotein translocase subunit SecF